MIVGFLTFLFLVTFVLYLVYQERNKPHYQPAATATFFYQPGEPNSDFMIGAVELAIKRKLPIRLIQSEIEVPILQFYDSYGKEIEESRMTGLWNLYDMNVRFGIEVSQCPLCHAST
jgi:hypothetical protein